MTKRTRGTRRHKGVTVRLKYVSKETLPSGTVRYRLRKTGRKSITLYCEPRSDEFSLAYHAWLRGEVDPTPVEKALAKTSPYSLALLITIYRSGTRYKALATSSKRTYGRILDGLHREHGEKDVRRLKPRHVRDMRDKPEGATAGNRLVSVLRILCEEAKEADWIEINPCGEVAKRVHKTKGFHSWTDSEISQFLAYWKPGTMQRLAMMLLLDTGQRSSDVCRMGAQHVRGGVIRVTQQKTGAVLELVLQQSTRAEIARHPTSLVFIRTAHENPFSVKGFQKWFSNAATLAGLPHCSSHGLRKARARMLAERGATTEQIKSVTGHTTDAEVNRYVRAASQKRIQTHVAETIGELDLSTKRHINKKGGKT